MRAWFLSFSGSNFLAGQLAKLTGAGSNTAIELTEASAAESLALYIDVYTVFGLIAVIAGIVVLILSPKLNKLMHGIR